MSKRRRRGGRWTDEPQIDDDVDVMGDATPEGETALGAALRRAGVGMRREEQPKQGQTQALRQARMRRGTSANVDVGVDSEWDGTWPPPTGGGYRRARQEYQRPPKERKCALVGCNGWTMRDSVYCASHRDTPGGVSVPLLRGADPAVLAALAEAEGDADGRAAVRRMVERDRRRDAFAAAVRAGRGEEALDEGVRDTLAQAGQGINVAFELGVLRLLLQQVVAMDSLDGDPRDTVTTATRITDAIARLVRMQRVVSGGATDDISEAMTRLLLDMGLVGDDAAPVPGARTGDGAEGGA